MFHPSLSYGPYGRASKSSGLCGTNVYVANNQQLLCFLLLYSRDGTLKPLVSLLLNTQIQPRLLIYVQNNTDQERFSTKFNFKEHLTRKQAHGCFLIKLVFKRFISNLAHLNAGKRSNLYGLVHVFFGPNTS
jgi:hypothetical protein